MSRASFLLSLARFSLRLPTGMRVAIPTFGSEVSPRFCFARQVLVVDVENSRELARSTVPLGDTGYPDRLRVLEGCGATLLICGGFNRAFLPEAERAGIHVIWGIGGAVENAVRQLLAGKTESRGHPDCWCHRQRGHRGKCERS